jgi:hypothetical protein
MHKDAIKLNESGGKLFELLSEIILAEIFGEEKIFSQPKCPEMQIAPDIFIGDEQTPSHVVLVTHATAKNAAGVKVDRNIEELFEAKTRLSPRPIVVNLIWHSPIGWSEGHIQRQDEMFDCNWVAYRDCSEYDTALPVMIDTAADIAGLEREEAMTVVRATGIAQAFAKSLHRMIPKAEKGNNALIWKLEAARTGDKIEAISGYDLRLKDDLVSICLLDPNLVETLFNGAKLRFDDSHTPAVNSGALRKSNSIKGSFCQLEPGLRDRLNPMVSAIGISGLAALIQEVADSEGYSQLATVYEEQSTALKRLDAILSYASRRDLITLVEGCWKKNDNLFNGRCWPLYSASAVIKAKVNEDFGFLFAQRQALGDTNRGFGWDILNRYTRREKGVISHEELLKVCKVFENSLNQVKTSSLETLLGDIEYWQRVEIQKNKKGNPLPWYVRRTLISGGIDHVGFPDPCKTSLCPFIARAGGNKITGITRWHFSTASGDLLHILTNYSTTHKDKEYSAKSRIAHYEWNGKCVGKSSVRRIGIILDGSWSENKLSMFRSSGNALFRADEPDSWIKWLKE